MPQPSSRRAFLRLGLGLAVSSGSLLAACAPSAAPAPAAPAATAAPAAAQPANNPGLQALYDKAKAEGEVSFYGSPDARELAALNTAFGKRFPGLSVKTFEIRTDDVVKRAVAEASQGKVSFDMGEGRLSALSPLLDRDLLQGYDDWTALFPDLNPASVLEKGRFLVWYNLAYPIAYNTSQVKAADAPKSWEDLLDPKWKGKLLLEVRGNAFGYLLPEWGEEKVLDYAAKLKQQDPVFADGGTTTGQQLTAGVAPVAVGLYVHTVLQAQDTGAPVDWVRTMTPLGITQSAVYVMKGAPHPNATKLFLGWLASPEAQNIMLGFRKGSFYPGSPYPPQKEIEQNKVKLVVESSENFRAIDAVNQKIAALYRSK